MTNIDIEKKTVSKMVDLYCKKHHKSKKNCVECEKIKTYALNKLDLCIYKNKKPPCSKCTIHCYSDDKRKDIKKIMVYSGPRMIIHNPILAIIHLVKLFKRL